MLSWIIGTFIIILFLSTFVEVDAQLIRKSERKEKGWLNINGKKIF